MKKVPFYLVTGFLGSGKTTFLKNLLTQYANKKRIAIIQNEFADVGIDAIELRDTQFNFSLTEINKGSIFCVCLFSNFKEKLLDLVSHEQFDLVILEATGIADPIAIAQLFDDTVLREKLYLAHVWSIVDVVRFSVAIHIQAVIHQITIADTIILNKCDLVNDEIIDKMQVVIKQINPFASIVCTIQCNFKTKNVIDAFARPLNVVDKQQICGCLTRCGASDYQSQVFKTTSSVNENRLHLFLSLLTCDTYRLKGYVQLIGGKCVMIQYIPNYIKIIPIQSQQRPTEIIAIGIVPLSFALLQ